MNVVTQLFQKIDSVSINAIQTIYSALVSALLPVFSVGVTIYVVYWGYEMIYGRAPLTAGAFVWRMLRIWLIYLIAFNWSTFSTLVVNVFTNTADGVATAVCTGVGGTSCGTPETAVGSQLSNVLTNGLDGRKDNRRVGRLGRGADTRPPRHRRHHRDDHFRRRRHHARDDREGRALRAARARAPFHRDGPVRLLLDALHRMAADLRPIRNRADARLRNSIVSFDDHERRHHQCRRA